MSPSTSCAAKGSCSLAVNKVCPSYQTRAPGTNAHILTCGSDARSPVPELSGQGSGSMGDSRQKLSRLLNAMRMMVAEGYIG
ncbi:hypothetical protein N7451_006889 [Penicillium sp. IBT 35674x]|nr:hypothetical protein N7451_006889 [Penicillium sp. IBT 35674x]